MTSTEENNTPTEEEIRESGTGFGERGDNYHAAFLWSGMHPENDVPVYIRLLLLPFYLSVHAYHCIRGTPIHVEYGDHTSRNSKPSQKKEKQRVQLRWNDKQNK